MYVKSCFYYEASDGTRFDSEEECLLYELNREYPDWENGFTMYDKDVKPLKFDYEDPTALDECEYIHIKTIEGLKALKEVNNYFYGYIFICNLEDVGYYKIAEDDATPVAIDVQIAKLTNALNKMKETKA